MDKDHEKAISFLFHDRIDNDNSIIIQKDFEIIFSVLKKNTLIK